MKLECTWIVWIVLVSLLTFNVGICLKLDIGRETYTGSLAQSIWGYDPNLATGIKALSHFQSAISALQAKKEVLVGKKNNTAMDNNWVTVSGTGSLSYSICSEQFTTTTTTIDIGSELQLKPCLLVCKSWPWVKLFSRSFKGYGF